ncbi:MAG: DUF502 domain-containing protein [Planctomycetota bacterium]
MESPRPRRSHLGAALRAVVRTRITTGLIIVLPILLSIWVVKIVFYWLRDASMWVLVWALESEWFAAHVLHQPAARDADGQKQSLEAFLRVHPLWDWGLDIFSVLLTFVLLYVVGVFAANIFGRRILDFFDRLMERVPLVKTVYRATKQILVTFSGDQTQNYQRVVLIPFPQADMRCVGFLTNIFRDSLTGEELCMIFIPTTPNPTTGYLQVVKRCDITELNWSVEDAIRTIMSGGILKPDYLTIVPNSQMPLLAGRMAAGATVASVSAPASKQPG